nr:hypothetical protein AgrTiSule1_00197 [Agrobacterium tumefaciens]QEG97518.1 hypothetical protein AgrTiCFBP1935_00191 [Agrobacterium tumefaciens]QEG97725.1 hypothetical protein AgrTiKerr108_00202 [Agrobacterium tumefaciens]QEG97958.1 hypothetical protein AgrTiKerr27_00228 [Agrobacterium tumefaciens]QEG98154.1 hypothetical protein AgrTiT37_00191 [Agrobacterium tumefaciens]
MRHSRHCSYGLAVQHSYIASYTNVLAESSNMRRGCAAGCHNSELFLEHHLEVVCSAHLGLFQSSHWVDT